MPGPGGQHTFGTFPCSAVPGESVSVSDNSQTCWSCCKMEIGEIKKKISENPKQFIKKCMLVAAVVFLLALLTGVAALIDYAKFRWGGNDSASDSLPADSASPYGLGA